MYLFLVILLYRPLSRVPDLKDYWSTGILGNAFVKNCISRDHLLQIKHCLAVANPTPEENRADPLAKTWHFLNEVRQILQSLWLPGRDMALDESQ